MAVSLVGLLTRCSLYGNLNFCQLTNPNVSPTRQRGLPRSDAENQALKTSGDRQGAWEKALPNGRGSCKIVDFSQSLNLSPRQSIRLRMKAGAVLSSILRGPHEILAHVVVAVLPGRAGWCRHHCLRGRGRRPEDCRL